MTTGPDRRLRQRIRDAGPITFFEFMEEALYGEGGYYARQALPIGEEGDFITGSSFSPLLGRATGRIVSRLDRALGQAAEFFEAGCGSGRHLAAVAAACQEEEKTPGKESTARRLRGWDRVVRTLPAGAERVGTLAEVAPRSVNGLLFSYELFDALAVHRLIGRNAEAPRELWVTLDQEHGFAWHETWLSDPSLPSKCGVSAANALVQGQIADVAPGWAALYRELAERLGRGLLVTCDYGFERAQLLDPRVRMHGTLACYRRHTVHREPFVHVGEQDLTAHVDFTALREAGEQAGLKTVAFTRLARWLIAGGVFEDLATGDPALRQAAQQILDGEGMGEEIRVLVQARDVDLAAVLDPSLLR